MKASDKSLHLIGEMIIPLGSDFLLYYHAKKSWNEVLTFRTSYEELLSFSHSTNNNNYEQHNPQTQKATNNKLKYKSLWQARKN